MTATSFIYNSIVTQFGPPATLLSDQGSHFRNCIVANLTNKVNTVHKFSTAYNPCCNGLTERFNRTLVECNENKTKFQPSTWEVMLPSVLWNYCTKVHNTIKMTPFEAIFGTKPNQTCVLKKMNQHRNSKDCEQTSHQAKKNLSATATKIRAAQQEINYHVPKFKIDQQVLKFNSTLNTTRSKKFKDKWKGPYTIYAIGKHHSYFLENTTGFQYPLPVSGSRLKAYQA
ncbi:hypothetical protein DSO57_1039695 [Entomophthora muscae]|uniref:Uncharacterized protein n=1 Tax=Entomophthora muscae TaxID=34485 RepID=A0ACC2U9Q6_9FUNG|nr:hypothetical protein DSO57_1039695 [Entomophthora muscae]